MDEASGELARDAAQLGRKLVDEMRAPVPDDDDERPWATGMLRWGADELDDESVFVAVVVACGLVRDDDERWRLADGVIAETIRTRPAVHARWLAQREHDEHVRAVEAIQL